MIFKKRVCAIAAVVLFAAVTSAAGSSKGSTAVKTDDWPKDIVIGAAVNPASVYYMSAAYLSDKFRKDFGIRGTPVSGPTEEFIMSINEGRMQFSNMTGPLPAWAATGTATFAKLGKLPIRLLAAGPDMPYIFMTLKKSGIRNIDDFKGKKLAFDYKGVPYVPQMAKDVMALHGISEKDVTIGPYGLSQEGGKQLVDGVVDVCFASGPVPQAWVTELALINDVAFIPVPREDSQKISQKSPWWRPFTLKAKSYKGADSDMPSITTLLSHAGHADLPDSFVYQVLKYQYDPKYRPEFEKLHRVIPREITLQRAVTPLGLPFHAGAVQFYKDYGVWTKELDAYQTAALKQLGAKR